MTESETLELVAEVNARWPHAPLPSATAALWTHELADLPIDRARSAVAAHDRAGERFPPTAGLVRKLAVEPEQDLPDWAHVWGEVMAALRAGFHASRQPPAEQWSSPLVAAFVRDVGWRRLCLEGYDTTFAAQCRDQWRALAAGAERDAALVGLPTAGLSRLERVNGEPRRLDAALAKVLPPGDPEAVDEAPGWGADQEAELVS